MTFHSEIITLLLSGKIQTKEELHRVKIQMCKIYHMKTIPRDSEILAQLPIDTSENDFARDLLRKKSMRTLSGVAVVAAMTAPEPCPHGRCLPCPGGPTQHTPQSYTGFEPAAMRAIFHNFDPYLQIKNRVEQLHAIGHSTDKVDLILMGGTFTARTVDYQTWFVKRCYDALNASYSRTLETAKIKNETAPSRCIGLTIETRPDWLRLQQIDHALHFGTTRVELGIQSVYDDILNRMERGHTVSDSIAATRLAKNAGLKVGYHIMPGLPGSTEKRDLSAFRTLFRNANFQPDLIKIYPTLIVEGTSLYDLWKRGEYEPLSTERAAVLIARMKECIPEWVRIQRIQRDIPVQKISAGITKSNLRQLIEKEMKHHGTSCRCIRCREIGQISVKKKIDYTTLTITLRILRYHASNSEEVFLMLEDKHQDVLIGYLRLRDILVSHRPELVKKPCMIIRELKILGREAPLGERSSEALQHRGYGKQLLKAAEDICKNEFDKTHLFVLSGVGVKPYYRSLGFTDEGVYLQKTLPSSSS